MSRLIEIERGKCCGTCIYFSKSPDCGHWYIPRGSCSLRYHSSKFPRELDCKECSVSDVLMVDFCKDYIWNQEGVQKTGIILSVPDSLTRAEVENLRLDIFRNTNHYCEFIYIEKEIEVKDDSNING